MKVLDLFSGIGGFSLGLECAGFQTIAFCEIEPFCRKVLNKHWPGVPIHEDVRKLDGKQYKGSVDIVCGGFPCQPFSVAGKKKGADDDRDLWPEMYRIIQESEPTWVIGENVAGFVDMALERTLTDLEGLGYETQPFIIPACAVNAPHRRDRVWIVAHSMRKGLQRLQQSDTVTIQTSGKKRLPKFGYDHDNELGFPFVPESVRMDDGLSNRVDRVKGLGNAVVPQIPYILGKMIKEAQGNE